MWQTILLLMSQCVSGLFTAMLNSKVVFAWNILPRSLLDILSPQTHSQSFDWRFFCGQSGLRAFRTSQTLMYMYARLSPICFVLCLRWETQLTKAKFMHCFSHISITQKACANQGRLAKQPHKQRVMHLTLRDIVRVVIIWCYLSSGALNLWFRHIIRWVESNWI